jgi:anti-sigma B factor antagonist
VSSETIAVERQDAVAVVAVSGEHDVFTAPSLRAAVNEPLERGEPVVVDLTAATFIDSSILAVLLGGLRRAREGKVGFAVVLDDAADSPVRRILDVTGLVPVFPIREGRALAVAAAGAGENA